MQTWPNLSALDLPDNFAKARAALGVCRAAGDRLTPLKVMQTTIIHAAHLKARVDALNRQENVDNRAQRKTIAKAVEELRALHAEAKGVAGMK